MEDRVYDVGIHFRRKCKKLKNIDLDKYSCIDFIADIREVHGFNDENMFRITCSVDDSDVNMDISNDNDVLSMFSRNVNRIAFDVFVEDVDVEVAENEERYGDGIQDESGEESGDENGYESGEKSGGESAHESSKKSDDKSGEKNESGDDMSDYKSNDHCESKNPNDSELEDDPLHGSLNRDGCLLPSETGCKVKLEKCMVFVDTNAFRKVLKEFVIQEGFKIMRIRNENTRVTAHCSVKDCPGESMLLH